MTLSTVLASLDSRWRKLSTPAQRVLLATLTFGCALVLLVYAWLPAQRGRAALGVALPLMRAELATMEAQATEIKAMGSVPLAATAASVQARPTPANAASVASLQAHFGARATVTPRAPGAFTISHLSTPYAAWLDALDLALARYGLSIIELKIEPLDGGKSVRTTVTVTPTATPKPQ